MTYIWELDGKKISPPPGPVRDISAKLTGDTVDLAGGRKGLDKHAAGTAQVRNPPVVRRKRGAIGAGRSGGPPVWTRVLTSTLLLGPLVVSAIALLTERTEPDDDDGVASPGAVRAGQSAGLEPSG